MSTIAFPGPLITKGYTCTGVCWSYKSALLCLGWILFTWGCTSAPNTSETDGREGQGSDNVDRQAVLAALEGEMVRVEGGTFLMGCTDEQAGCGADEFPIREVSVATYWIGRYEVTQEAWFAVMGTTPWGMPNCARCPVERVSYHDAVAFCSRLSELTSQQYRLPTEAEWEFAARGGSLGRGTKYSGSDHIDAVAWYDGAPGDGGTRPVGLLKPNELGLYDMSGNVREWCSDLWVPLPDTVLFSQQHYSSLDIDEEHDLEERSRPGPERRVLRGGFFGSNMQGCRVSKRIGADAQGASFMHGFRLAMVKGHGRASNGSSGS